MQTFKKNNDHSIKEGLYMKDRWPLLLQRASIWRHMKINDHSIEEGLDMKDRWPLLQRASIWKIDAYCFAEGLNMKAHENQWPYHQRGSWYERSMTIALQRASIWKINDHCLHRRPWYERSMTIAFAGASIWKINDHCLCRGPWYERLMTIAFAEGVRPVKFK